MHIRTNKYLNVIFRPVLLLCEYLGKYHPVILAKIRYFARFHKFLNLKDPKDLNEKILFLSLRTDTMLWTKLADKYRVREYIHELGLDDILVKLYGVYDSVEDIDFPKLPNSFVLKTTHGSGDIRIINDKSQLNLEDTVESLQKDLNTVYGPIEGGLHYMRIPRKIIVEELMHNDETTSKYSSSIIDYKIWCFNGKAHYIWACCNRDKHGTDVMTYDTNWNAHPEYSIFNNEYRKGMLIPKPMNLEKMLHIAEQLSKPFPVVRVDLYDINGKIYFGEMTFTSLGGLMDFYTPEFLRSCGEKIDLSGVKIIR